MGGDLGGVHAPEQLFAFTPFLAADELVADKVVLLGQPGGSSHRVGYVETSLAHQLCNAPGAGIHCACKRGAHALEDAPHGHSFLAAHGAPEVLGLLGRTGRANIDGAALGQRLKLHQPNAFKLAE